jgi:hypothetical protein
MHWSISWNGQKTNDRFQRLIHLVIVEEPTGQSGLLTEIKRESDDGHNVLERPR